MLSKKHKEEILQKITEDFSKMSQVVLNQLALLENVLTPVQVVMSDEDYKGFELQEERIDDYEISISNQVISALVSQQPQASDLRMTVAIQRMIVNLERIGDLVMNIVHFLHHLESKQLSKVYHEQINNMLVQCVSMVKKALKSFELRDEDYAVWTIKNDDNIDEMNKTLFKSLINKIEADSKTRQKFYEFYSINNILTSLERIADNATNIAEASIYYLKGIDVRHRKMDDNGSVME